MNKVFYVVPYATCRLGVGGPLAPVAGQARSRVARRASRAEPRISGRRSAPVLQPLLPIKYRTAGHNTGRKKMKLISDFVKIISGRGAGRKFKIHE